MLSTISPVKAALATSATAALNLAGAFSAAATGALPGAAQDTAHEVLAKIGVTVPGPNEASAGHPTAVARPARRTRRRRRRPRTPPRMRATPRRPTRMPPTPRRPTRLPPARARRSRSSRRTPSPPASTRAPRSRPRRPAATARPDSTELPRTHRPVPPLVRASPPTWASRPSRLPPRTEASCERTAARVTFPWVARAVRLPSRGHAVGPSASESVAPLTHRRLGEDMQLVEPTELLSSSPGRRTVKMCVVTALRS